MKQTKFTRPLAPWMKDPEISSAKNFLDNLRTKSRGLNHSDQTAPRTTKVQEIARKKNNYMEKSYFPVEGVKFW